ncbi:glycosyl hydrolase family 95 catalytic domain-containing protein [Amycolatopsis nalaikhensis]|uniref:Glycoside hydrolase N-terminal domain-containing protein n=1 Tax=Amycolatopsis nalaikhensis TaxID=715472 RepID=A0ABY8XR93_9PSEU|nr:glycoside hydrolase N-terminal domain-containing protein [Amycolatopsis sp. 2-2]WIV58185.1 glycoside hydrolase N-terminal domain-containing protein [Amycolatopsis sp. 2-2]
MTDLLLSWPHPAHDWTEALPVGNGRLGAMVFGGPGRTRVQVNDATVWSGTPNGPAAALSDIDAGPDRLAEVREAVFAKDFRRAEELLMAFEGPYSQEFLPYVDLWLTLPDGVSHGRTLNLDSGVVTERLTIDGHDVERTTWVSRPAQVLCVALTGPIDVEVDVSTPLREVSRDGLDLGIEIPVDGAPRHEPQVAEPLRYGTVEGYDPFGAVSVRIARTGAGVLVVLASSTSAYDAWIGDRQHTRDEHRRRAAVLAEAAIATGAEALRRAHEADLRPLLAASSLRIGDRRGGTHDVADLLTGKDDQLTATVLFQYGRYLLASASRPGAPPANLQGIWNDDLRPAWSSNYTININTQMNYWAAETTGLGECHLPLFDLLGKLASTGADVAREMYGARGWVTHHNTDPWGWALPAGMGHGNPSWALWQLGGAWLVQHAWEHYDFTRDRGFLASTAWPLLRGCAEFCLDWLVEHDGFLDTCPSTSPENLFLSDAGTKESLTYSATMDVALIRAVFERSLAAAGELGVYDPVCTEIAAALPRLRPLPVLSDGRLGEWAEDLTEEDPTHRHLSHLVALYPLGQIDAVATPELAEAARRVLERRGPGAMGWSWAWKIALRARLGDGETARKLLDEAAQPFTGDRHRDAPVDGSEWGGLLPNLFSTHPPFQIDGNYGFLAGLAELVVQSQTGVVTLLPALPAEWTEGEARGLRCRGGLAADVEWRGGDLVYAVLRRLSGDPAEPVRVRYRGRETELWLRTGESTVLKGL